MGQISDWLPMAGGALSGLSVAGIWLTTMGVRLGRQMQTIVAIQTQLADIDRRVTETDDLRERIARMEAIIQAVQASNDRIERRLYEVLGSKS